MLSDTDRLTMLAPRAGRVRAVLDTDTFNEIDDQFAVVQAILSSDRIGLEAIYAAPFHNHNSNGPGDGMERSYQEILALLERLDVDAGGFAFRGVSDYVGAAGLALDAPAVDDLIARARSSTLDNPLYVIAIGAISNVASALIKAPDLVDRIVVVWLAGHSLEWPDQMEFNLRQDIGGSRTILDSGVPLVLVPCMGVVSHLHSTIPEIERYVEPFGEIGKFLAMRFKEYGTDPVGWSKEIWDMAPVGWLINADWAPSVLVSTPILTDQITYSIDRRRHLMRYVTHVHRNAIMRDFFAKLKARAHSHPG